MKFGNVPERKNVQCVCVGLYAGLLLLAAPCLKNVPPLACYNFDTRERILIFLAEMLPTK